MAGEKNCRIRPERRRGRLDFEARAALHAHDFAPHRWQYCLNATLQTGESLHSNHRLGIRWAV